jgi:hypothetical protein
MDIRLAQAFPDLTGQFWAVSVAQRQQQQPGSGPITDFFTASNNFGLRCALALDSPGDRI